MKEKASKAGHNTEWTIVGQKVEENKLKIMYCQGEKKERTESEGDWQEKAKVVKESNK